jgi:putative hydrolase of the HAD superfamily
MTGAGFPDNVRLVFDLDDTLHSERLYALSGFNAAAAWAERELGVEGLAHEMTTLLDQGHLGAVFERALKKQKPDFSAAELERLRFAYRDHTPAISVYDDVMPLLNAVTSPMGMITDGSHGMQTRKVEALGLRERFAEIVYTGALGPGRAFIKPHPRAYEMIEAQLGGDGVRMVYVGDNPAKDFVVPNARGWLSVRRRMSPFTRSPNCGTRSAGPRRGYRLRRTKYVLR